MRPPEIERPLDPAYNHWKLWVGKPFGMRVSLWLFKAGIKQLVKDGGPGIIGVMVVLSTLCAVAIIFGPLWLKITCGLAALLLWTVLIVDSAKPELVKHIRKANQQLGFRLFDSSKFRYWLWASVDHTAQHWADTLARTYDVRGNRYAPEDLARIELFNWPDIANAYFAWADSTPSNERTRPL